VDLLDKQVSKTQKGKKLKAKAKTEKVCHRGRVGLKVHPTERAGVFSGAKAGLGLFEK
jgi:hypothetical protein